MKSRRGETHYKPAAEVRAVLVLPRTRATQGELAAILCRASGQIMPQPLDDEQAEVQREERGKDSASRKCRVNHPQGRTVVGPIHLALDDAQNP
jgi:hypothetical protein